MIKEVLSLRSWQQEAFERFEIENKKDFLVVASTGAGKTNFALYTAHNQLKNGFIERIVIVCPSSHLKYQWSEAAHFKLGLNINPNFSNDNFIINDDYDGVCVTYQQVGFFPEIHKLHCSRKTTLIIFDELHHAGENLKWGESIKYAFEHAVNRLSLSGTPFRRDNNSIPFVKYENNQSRADFTYSYADALRDGVCRYIFFPSFEGEMQWESNGNIVSAKFDERLSQTENSRRLRTALSTSGNWIKSILKEADDKLNSIRINGHIDAGGLVIAIDQEHARQISNILYSITSEIPVLAVSDDSEANALIKNFSKGTQKWIVAVKMVSEGVDIPRLRVGVYATNCTSELFFRQSVGRLIRIVPNLEEQNAYLFIPKDETLVSYAKEIMKIRDHQLEEDIESGNKELSLLQNNNLNERSAGNNFTVLTSSTALKDGVISAEGDILSTGLIDFAQQIKLQSKISSPVEEIAKILKAANAYNTSSEKEVLIPETPKYQRELILRQNIQRIVGWLSARISLTYEQIHSKLNYMVGITNGQENASEELLKIKLEKAIELKNLAKEDINGCQQTFK